MEANELRLWDKCAACRKELGPSVYRFYLAKRIERLEIMACSGSSLENGYSHHALRRLVALLAQERIMLDMETTELKTAGFDGAFIALGRIVRARGFKAEMGWYTEDELRAHRAAKDAATKSEHLPETGDA
ncbi:hypothetical protein PENSPDRAFT_668494 [Peniophora sp. CONT]|nr:hypothetical protein PENSPDRAFT_668494 [Peniophora sp. CONT]